MSKDKKLEEIQNLAKRGKIAYASSGQVKKYKDEVDRILDLIGVKSAFVSDESQFSDFSFLGEERLRDLSDKVGVEIDMKDFIWEIAKEMRNKP